MLRPLLVAVIAVAGFLAPLATPGEARAQNFARCESRGYTIAICPMDTRDGVGVLQQLSRAPCLPGRTYIFDRRGVLTRDGCRAVFANRRHIGWGAGYPGGGWNAGGGGWAGGMPVRPLPQPVRPPYDPEFQYYDEVRCESRRGARTDCTLRRPRQARILRQISREPCIQGQNWGVWRGGVWVAEGCRALFGSRR